MERIHYGTFSFKPGFCLYNKRYNLYYAELPKNASSSMRRVLDWENYNFIKQTNYIEHFIVILRDPVTRFESAMNMFAEQQYIRQDQHIMPQTYLLNGAPTNVIDYFYYNSNIITDIKEYYNLDIDDRTHKNKTKVKSITVTDNKFIKEFYKEDYELINSVNFVNKK